MTSDERTTKKNKKEATNKKEAISRLLNKKEGNKKECYKG
jgi:hypothetical protein